MNLELLLQPEIQDFINKNLNEDSSKLALKKNPFPEINYSVLINQILSKKKAKNKLSTWFSNENIIYPDKISIERLSNDFAKYLDWSTLLVFCKIFYLKYASIIRHFSSCPKISDHRLSYMVDYRFIKPPSSVCEMTSEISALMHEISVIRGYDLDLVTFPC